MDKALLDYEVSIDAECKLATVGKPFAIEGECVCCTMHQFCGVKGNFMVKSSSFMTQSASL